MKTMYNSIFDIFRVLRDKVCPLGKETELSDPLFP